MSAGEPLEVRAADGERLWLSTEMQPGGEHAKFVICDAAGEVLGERLFTLDQLEAESNRLSRLVETMDDLNSDQCRN